MYLGLGRCVCRPFPRSALSKIPTFALKGPSTLQRPCNAGPITLRLCLERPAGFLGQVHQSRSLPAGLRKLLVDASPPPSPQTSFILSIITSFMPLVSSFRKDVHMERRWACGADRHLWLGVTHIDGSHSFRWLPGVLLLRPLSARGPRGGMGVGGLSGPGSIFLQPQPGLRCVAG